MRIAHIHADSGDAEGALCLKLCLAAESAGHHSVFYHAFGTSPEGINARKIGMHCNVRKKTRFRNKAEELLLLADREIHLRRSRLTDRSGFYSRSTTKRLVRQLKAFHPDVVHLHRLHGYYLNLPILLEYLKKENIPVLWTMRDCWAWTGHCTWYTDAILGDSEEGNPENQRGLGCKRWKYGCGDCPLIKRYPKSLLADQSKRNWQEKRALLSGFSYLVMAVPSPWLQGEIENSFLSDNPVYVVPDTLDTDIFTPQQDEALVEVILRYYHMNKPEDKPLVIAFADQWNEQSGLAELLEVAQGLENEVQIAVIGMDEEQRKSPLPDNMLALRHVQSDRDLALLLSRADLFWYPTHGEASDLPLLEAMACGTPVVCYDVCGFADVLSSGCGAAVGLMNVEALEEAILHLLAEPKHPERCRNNALSLKKDYTEQAYLRLYENLYLYGPACAGSKDE